MITERGIIASHSILVMLIGPTCRRSARETRSRTYICKPSFNSPYRFHCRDTSRPIPTRYKFNQRVRRNELFVVSLSFLLLFLSFLFFSFLFHLSFLRDGNGTDQYDDGLFPLKRIFTALFSPYSQAG